MERLFFSEAREHLHYVKATRYGWMILNKYDDIISDYLDRYGEWCEFEMELLRPLLSPGMIVLDVGANIGSHTLFFAQMVGPQGHVYAFEPQRLPFLALCGNIALNQHLNVTAHPFGLGDYETSMAVPAINRYSTDNVGAIALQATEKDESAERVAIRTIDSLPLPDCNLLKIDVEGMEIRVLKGALKTILTFRPYLYMEHKLYQRERAQAVEAYLRALQYVIFRHDIPFFNPNNFNGAPLNGPHYSETNILCVPLEKLPLYRPNLPELSDMKQGVIGPPA